MAIRKLEYTVYADKLEPAARQFGGIQGEHNATEIVFKINQDFFDSIFEQADGKTIIYRFDAYDCVGNTLPYDPQQLTESTVNYLLENWITKEGGNIRVHLVISILDNEETEIDAFTFPALLNLKEKPRGTIKEHEEYESIPSMAYNAKVSAERSEDAADRSEAALKKHAIIGENKNWFIWDSKSEQYIDSGVSAEGPQGEKGEQGIQGIQGPKGEKGDKGIDGTVSFDELTEEQKEFLKMGVGERTAEGGEIFNDYETNKALSKHTSVRGSGNRAGSKGFRILSADFFTETENLIPFPYDFMTDFNGTFPYVTERDGVTVTVNEDRSISLTGEVTEFSWTLSLWHPVKLETGSYTLTGCPSEGFLGGFGLTINSSFAYDTGSGAGFNWDAESWGDDGWLDINIREGKYNNFTFHPKLEKYGVEPIAKIGCELEEIVLPEDIEYNENLISFPYDFMTDFDGSFPYVTERDGVTVTVNEDRSIVLNGTIAPYIDFRLLLDTTPCEKNTDYYLSGDNVNCPYPYGLTGAGTVLFCLEKGGRHITVDELEMYGFDIFNVALGYGGGEGFTFNNMVFYPKLEKGDHATRFEPPAPGLAIDDVVSLRLDYNHMDVGFITSIEDKTVTVTLEGNASDYVVSQFNLKSAESQAECPWYNTLSVNAKPDIGTVDIGMYASAEGLNNTARRIATRAGGEGNDILGDFGSADGQGNKVGYCSHSSGRDNDILGEYCEGGGQYNSITKKSRYTRIGGYGNKLSDSGTEAVNKNWDEARFDAADIHGIGNVGKGFAIFIRGLGNKVTAKFGSITGGKGNEVTAPFGRAGGISNKVTGDIGDAFGNETEAGNTAVSRGYKTRALGWLSAAFGYFTRALQRSQFVVGEYNSPKSTTLFEVGNGTSDTTRSNAFEVYRDGHAEVQTQGTADNSVVQMKTLNNLIAFGTLDPTTDELPAEQQNCLFYVKISE